MICSLHLHNKLQRLTKTNIFIFSIILKFSTIFLGEGLKDSSTKNANSYINRDGAKATKGHVYYQTDAEATIAAKAAGYEPIKDRIHGQKVYYNKENKTYITRDVGSNNGAGSRNGGVWKMAKSLRELGSKDTRMGTYDANFKKNRKINYVKYCEYS